MRQLKPQRWMLLGVVGFLALGLTAVGQDAVLRGRKIQPAPPLPAVEKSALGQVPTAPSPRLLQRLGTSQLRHGSRILCLAYRPDGQILAAGGGSDPIRVWDASTGQQKFTCNETWINAIVFTPRGSIMVTAGMFKSIRLWETATGKEAGKLEDHKAPIKALALSPAGDLLVSASQDGVIVLWEMLTKKKITELRDHTDEVTCLAFCPTVDIPLFVSGSTDRTVRVWDADTNKQKLKIDAGCGVLAVAITPDGKTVFSAGDDNLIRAWDAETGKLVDTLKGHDGMVVSLIVSRDGKTLVSGGRDKSIRLWDLKAMGNAPRIIARHLGDSDALALTKDGSRVATAGLNDTIRIFETATGKEQFTSDAPQAPLTGLAVARDGKTVAAITAPGLLYVWDPTTGTPLRHWQTGDTAGEIAIAYTPDGTSVVTAGHSIRFWDPQTGKQRFELPQGDVKMMPAVSLTFSPDGKTMVVGHRSQDVTLWNLDTKSQTGAFKYPGQPAALAFSVDGALLAVAGTSKIVLWDRATGKEARRFECKDAPAKTLLPDVAALAFSPDKKTLAVACYDGVIRMIYFDGPNVGKEASMCEGHQSVPYAIAFSRDGRTLLSGSFDATARLWEPTSGIQLAELKGHFGPVYGVGLSPDSRIAYSASADTTVGIWDATGFGKAGPPKAALTEADLEAAWRELASENAAAARLVVWRLIANPKDVAGFLKKKVHLVDVARINKLLVDLDSDQYDERDAAFKELSAHGRWLEGRLHEALVMPPSLEYKRRIEQMLEKLSVPGALSLRQEQLRLRRAMMVLEYVADAPSRDLLARLGKQAPEEAFRHEAQTTLGRLK